MIDERVRINLTEKLGTMEVNHRQDVLHCLCNDNIECNNKRIPETFMSKKFPKDLGYCTTNAYGRCYTVKDTDFIGLKSRFGPNESPHPVFSKANGNIHSSESIGSIRVRYGCLSSPSKISFSCNGHLAKHLIPKTISCCNSTHFCNADLVPVFHHHVSDDDAIESALANMNYVQKARLMFQPFVNRELNVGSVNINDERKHVSQFGDNFIPSSDNANLQNVFNIILIVTFSCVFVFLLIMLGIIYVCYKRRIRKRKFKVCESLLWYSALNSHGQVSSSATASYAGHHTSRKSNGEINPDKDLADPTANSSQTVSSHLTKSANSGEGYHTFNSCKLGFSQTLTRTIGKQVTLEKYIGSGRFTDIWKGSWRGEPIVAKVFLPDDRLSQSIWKRTTSINRSILLRHRAIQGLVAADWLYYPSDKHQTALARHYHTAPCLRAMIVSEWYQWGTLKSFMSRHAWRYLRTTTNSPRESVQLVHTLYSVEENTGMGIMTTTDELHLGLIVKMMLGLARGLCFLHSEFIGTRGKPALAHRNLKPANVLVRSDWTLCIGDLGFCIRSPPNPLPTPLTELNRLYTQYVYSLTGNNQVTSVLTSSHKLQTPEQAGLDRSTTNPFAAKFSLERVDLLDWWPVGGLQIGNPRYMAPELLMNTAVPFSFEGHQKADVYSLSLILWELITWALPRSDRFMPDGSQYRSSYNPAYQSEWMTWVGHHSSKALDPLTPTEFLNRQGVLDYQNQEPDLCTMRHLVCDLNQRPQLPDACLSQLVHALDFRVTNLVETALHSDGFQVNNSVVGEKTILLESSSSGASSLNGAQTLSSATIQSESRSNDVTQLYYSVLSQLSKLLTECWATDPDSRLTALRIRKTLRRLLDQLEHGKSQDKNEVDWNEHVMLNVKLKQSSADTSTVRAEA